MALFDKAKEFFAGFSFLVLKSYSHLLKTQMIISLWRKYSTDPFIPKNGAQMNSVRPCYIACDVAHVGLDDDGEDQNVKAFFRCVSIS